MDFQKMISQEEKLRIVQETVPGKQITLAHIIANPDPVIYQKLGLNPAVDYSRSAIGILTICPTEIAIIAGDIATKTSNVELGFVDRFSGTLIVTGRVADVESSLRAIADYAQKHLGCVVCEITKT